MQWHIPIKLLNWNMIFPILYDIMITIVLQRLESAQFYDMIMNLQFDSTYTFL